MFDSMYMCLPTKVKAQIATLLATEQPAIKVNYMDVHMQSGGYDCGLFAIAFASYCTSLWKSARAFHLSPREDESSSHSMSSTARDVPVPC